MDEPTKISTKIYIPVSKAADTYAAHVLLSEGRDISKEQSVNELILTGAIKALPAENVKALELEKPSTHCAVRQRPTASPARNPNPAELK